MKKEFLVLVVIFLFSIGPTIHTIHSEIYRWTDQEGQRHLTNDLNEIPPSYREKAIKDLEQRKANPQGEMSIIKDTPIITPKENSTEKPNSGIDRLGVNSKEYWVNRVSQTKEKLQKAKDDLAEVNRKQIRNIELGGPGIQKNQQDLASQEKHLNKVISALENELNEDIPNEAREAGIPPGWLRDAGLNP